MTCNKHEEFFFLSIENKWKEKIIMKKKNIRNNDWLTFIEDEDQLDANVTYYFIWQVLFLKLMLRMTQSQ